MRRIFVSLLFLSLFFMGYAHEPEFSTAGFFRLPDTGRDVYSMNPAWRFHKGAMEGAETKEFNDKNAKFEISQINAVDLDSVFSRQAELEEAINKEIKEKNLDFYMFAATDILNANSKIIAMGNKAGTVEKAFGVNLDNNTAMLNNVVSRKKQMLPNILNNLD